MMVSKPRSGAVELFVLYDHPLDYPGHFVVRRFYNDQPTTDFAIAPSLDAARAEVHGGLRSVRRAPDDDPCIVEVWL